MQGSAYPDCSRLQSTAVRPSPQKSWTGRTAFPQSVLKVGLDQILAVRPVRTAVRTGLCRTLGLPCWIYSLDLLAGLHSSTDCRAGFTRWIYMLSSTDFHAFLDGFPCCIYSLYSLAFLDGFPCCIDSLYSLTFLDGFPCWILLLECIVGYCICSEFISRLMQITNLFFACSHFILCRFSCLVDYQCIVQTEIYHVQ